MAGEYEMTWDPTSRELVMTALSVPQPVPWRFVQTGPDRWRCRTGTNRGEVMTVRRGRTGSVTELEVAAARFTRDPWAAV
jgi:hypothetical protein